MKRKNIIVILGEPNSINSEIFLKSLNYFKKIKLNFIIIGNYSLLNKIKLIGYPSQFIDLYEMKKDYLREYASQYSL